LSMHPFILCGLTAIKGPKKVVFRLQLRKLG